jgi:hypothetical protein
MTSIKERKRAEFASFVSEVRGALEVAHKAANVACLEYVNSAPKTKEGHVADACGHASVVVYTPSYRLRKALHLLGELERGYQGAWHVSHFTKNVHTQSITAHEQACNAARDVLRARFPNDGTFYAPSRID